MLLLLLLLLLPLPSAVDGSRRSGIAIVCGNCSPIGERWPYGRALLQALDCKHSRSEDSSTHL